MNGASNTFIVNLQVQTVGQERAAVCLASRLRIVFNNFSHQHLDNLVDLVDFMQPL